MQKTAVATKVKEYVSKKAPWHKPYEKEVIKNLEKPKYSAQEVYEKIQKTREQMKKYQTEMLGHYNEDKDYKDLEVKGLEIRNKRKEIRVKINANHQGTVDTIMQLKLELQEQKQLFNDIVFVAVSKGKAVEVVDNNKQPMLPIFSVKLIKQ